MTSEVEDPPLALTEQVADGNLLEKLKRTFPEEVHGGHGKFQQKCCNLTEPLKRLGALLAFHLMNVAEAILGVIAVVVLLAGLSLSVAWLVLFLAGVVPYLLFICLPEFLAVTVLLALWVASWFNIYTLVAPYALLVGGGIGVFLHELVVMLVTYLVWIDVWLANYISPSLPSNFTPVTALQPDDCAKRFNYETLCKERDEGTFFCRLFTIASYFGVYKAFIGGLSAAVVFCSVILPAMSIVSGGDAPLFSSSLTFHTDPTVYVVLVLSSCVAGSVGLGIVAALSVKVTWCFFGESVATQEPEIPAENAPATSFTQSATPIPEASASV